LLSSFKFKISSFLESHRENLFGNRRSKAAKNIFLKAIVGNIGFEKKMDYTAIGDVVNDTFRLQRLTRETPNSVLISKSTYQKVRPFVEAQSLGRKSLGTSEAQMEIYQVTEKKELSDIEYLMHQEKIKDTQ